MSQDPMNSGWYYTKAGSPAGHEQGPLTWEELYLLACAGTVAPADLLWNPKLPRGVTAGLVPGLFPKTKVAPAPAVQTVAAPAAPQAPPQAAPVVPAPAVAAAAVVAAPVMAPQAEAHAIPVKTQTEAPAQDLFAEKLEETAAQEIRPEEPTPPQPERQSRNLPWLVVLLILVLAAAAVAAYFLYFRDAGGGGGGVTSTTVTPTTAPVAAAAAVWTELVPSGDAPAARSYHAMAYDPATARTILFGGSHADTRFSDTWALDLVSRTWTLLAASGSGPSARDYQQMVYDHDADAIVLFGGHDASGDLNDLWILDLTSNTWSELKPSGDLPPAREGHAMTYEPDTKRVLVFGGLDSESGKALNDLWAYDSVTNSWARLNPSGPPPPERETTAMAYCPSSNRVLLFGGLTLAESTDAELDDLWAYDPVANTWMEVNPVGTAPTTRQGHALVCAPALGGLLLYGGRHGDLDLDETWLLDPLTDGWTKMQSIGAAADSRDGHAMAYDTTAGVVVLFGGYDAGADRDFGDTWVYGPPLSEGTP